MARRRKNLNVAPPAPKQPKPKRPQGRELREIYKGLVTLSASNRINALALALQWYDKAQLYMISRNKGQALPADTLKALERAVKARKIGLSATMDGEKEQAFRTAIKLYETACAIVKPVSLDKMYAAFDAKKQKLEARQQVAESKFGNTLAELSNAIGGEVRLLVFDSPKIRQIVPNRGEIIYNKVGARQVVETIRRQGLLAAFAAEGDTIARCLSLETDGQGGYQISAEKYIAAQTRLLRSFVKYAGTATAPKRIVKLGATAEHGVIAPVQPPAPRQPSAPRATSGIARGPAKGPKVGGHYAEGSSMAMLLRRLEPGQALKVADVLAGIPAASPLGRLEALTKEVKRYGIGEIIWTGKDVVQMRLAQGVTL
jgi:hypothetical protein